MKKGGSPKKENHSVFLKTGSCDFFSGGVATEMKKLGR